MHLACPTVATPTAHTIPQDIEAPGRMIQPCKRPSRVKEKARRCRQISEHSIARVARHLHSEHADHDCVPDQQLHGAGPAHNSLRTQVPGQLHLARPSHAGSVGIHNRARSVQLAGRQLSAGSSSGGGDIVSGFRSWRCLRGDSPTMPGSTLPLSAPRCFGRRACEFAAARSVLQQQRGPSLRSEAATKSAPRASRHSSTLVRSSPSIKNPARNFACGISGPISSSGRLLALFSSS